MDIAVRTFLTRTHFTSTGFKTNSNDLPLSPTLLFYSQLKRVIETRIRSLYNHPALGFKAHPIMGPNHRCDGRPRIVSREKRSVHRASDKAYLVDDLSEEDNYQVSSANRVKTKALSKHRRSPPTPLTMPSKP